MLVPGVGTKPPNEWHDGNGQLWLRSLPSSISSNVSAYAFAHELTPRRFTYSQTFYQGERLLGRPRPAAFAPGAPALELCQWQPFPAFARSLMSFLLYLPRNRGPATYEIVGNVSKAVVSPRNPIFGNTLKSHNTTLRTTLPAQNAHSRPNLCRTE